MNGIDALMKETAQSSLTSSTGEDTDEEVGHHQTLNLPAV